MPNLTRITNYIDNFIYTVSRPRIAQILSSTVNAETIKNADINTRLMSVGALLTSGRVEECILLADQLDFSDITTEDSSLLVLIIFSKFYEHGLIDHHNAKALKQLLTAICPEALLAHTQKKIGPLSLINLDYAHTINPSVSGVVFFSEFIFSPGSRKCEVGYRIQRALASKGWDVSLFTAGEVKNYTSINQKDFAVIDVFAFYQMALDDTLAILARLRRFFRKIVMVDTDVWAGRFDDMLRSISSQTDYIWGLTAEWRLADEPEFKGRTILFPSFGGFDHLSNIIEAPLDWSTCTFNFTGSVQSYNLNRIAWLLEFIHRNDPIELKITNPQVDDGFEPEYSQQLYAQETAATHAAINLTTRKDGSRIVTGRSFEVISLNRLLVQESCPVFNRYFIEGEHFLEFSNIDELGAIIDFLRLHPKTAQALCRHGHRFYDERYSCKKLVEHFQTLL